MDLEQSIHHAQNLELSIVRGESVTWTVFKVEVEGHSLEFTAFGDLPVALNVFDDEPIPNLVDFLAVQGKALDRSQERTRNAERACQDLRGQLTLADDGNRATQAQLDAALGDASEATEGLMYKESLLAEAQSEAIEQGRIIEDLTQEAATRADQVEQMTAELRTFRIAYESAQERGEI